MGLGILYIIKLLENRLLKSSLLIIETLFAFYFGCFFRVSCELVHAQLKLFVVFLKGLLDYERQSLGQLPSLGAEMSM